MMIPNALVRMDGIIFRVPYPLPLPFMHEREQPTTVKVEENDKHSLDKHSPGEYIYAGIEDCFVYFCSSQNCQWVNN